MGKWENITVVFLDPIGPSVSEGLYNVVNLLKTNIGNDEKLFDIKIDSLDPIGDVIETWLVEVENVLTINFGELDYGNNGVQKPYMTLKIKNCNLN